MSSTFRPARAGPVHARLGLFAAVGVLACSEGSNGSASHANDFRGNMPAVAGAMTGTPPAAAAGGGHQGSGSVQGTPAQNGVVPLDPDSAASAGGSGAAPPGSAVAPPSSPPAARARLDNVFIFSRTLGYRHESLPAAIDAIRALGSANGFAVEATEDPARFADAELADVDVVVFLGTSEDVLDDAQQGALERFVRAGGGWVGVHAAADTEYGWAWYGQLLGGGAYLESHPLSQGLTVVVENGAHASTEHLPATFQVEDEPYNYRVNPRSAVSVLLRLDESSYAPGPDAMGPDHPIAWFHEFDGGRAWYTGLGHAIAMYSDPRFTRHLLGGIRWAAGVVP